jgi:phosphoglycolate phosphatase
MIVNVFFDLDGTLADPKEGITRCINYALDRLGLPNRSETDLTKFIGPPLRSAFAELLSSDDHDLIEKAVSLYRERYSEVGLFENRLYPGVVELLVSLQENEHRLCVVTSKPKIYAERIIKHFELGDCFSEVLGSELDGRFDNKTILVKTILRKFKFSPEETVMIGDRKEDIQAGRSNGTCTIGITYGYGSMEEIIESVPDHICHTPSEILIAITTEK